MLADRQKTHGKYPEFAAVEQALQNVIRAAPKVNQLSPMQISALCMIMHKAARIVCGSPNHLDHYRDLIGYAQLVLDELQKMPGATDTQTTHITLNGGTWK